MNSTFSFNNVKSDFIVRGVKCAGELLLPETEKKPPVIVMAHGFGAEKVFKLPEYAERFANEGMAVFLFDYRFFGESGGEPRHLLDPNLQLEDWKAALEHVRGLDEIDSDRIGLWGTSFAGGHALSTAANDNRIKAVSVQVPFVDAFSTVKMVSPMHALKTTIAGTYDLIRGAMGLEPYYIPVVGRPGELACMNTEESIDGYYSIIPEGSKWQNRCPARVIPIMLFYRPITSAHKIECPVLIVRAENDSLICPDSVKATNDRIKNSRLISEKVGHFDVYHGELFEKILNEQIDFFKKHLFE